MPTTFTDHGSAAGATVAREEFDVQAEEVIPAEVRLCNLRLPRHPDERGRRRRRKLRPPRRGRAGRRGVHVGPPQRRVQGGAAVQRGPDVHGRLHRGEGGDPGEGPAADSPAVVQPVHRRSPAVRLNSFGVNSHPAKAPYMAPSIIGRSALFLEETVNRYLTRGLLSTFYIRK